MPLIVRSFFLVATALFFLSATGFPKFSYVYHEDIEGYELQTRWIIHLSNKGLNIEGTNSLAKTFIFCSENHSLEKFLYQTHNGKFQYLLEREGEALRVEGNFDGKKKIKTYKIGEATWLQEFGFGLRSFLESSSKEYKFCFVNPKDLSLVKMVAYKKKTETINVNEEKIEARRVYVTLQGWKRAFWSADVWYDLKSNDLVLCKANRGPNTPFTVVTLLSKQAFDQPNLSK